MPLFQFLIDLCYHLETNQQQTKFFNILRFYHIQIIFNRVSEYTDPRLILSEEII